MEKFKLNSSADLYYQNTDKFKTTTISIHFYRPMGKEAAANALLAEVLKSSSRAYPTRLELEKHLERLYGGVVQSGVRKKGEAQVLSFMVNAPSGKYTGENSAEMLSQFLYEIVFCPNISNDGFDPQTVAIEKENLKNRINALLNDKKEYASERCVAEMCGGEPFGIYELGSVDDVSLLDEKSLKAHYDNVLQNSKVDIFVSGECNIDTVKSVFANVASNGTMPAMMIHPARQELQTVEETMDITQGKLVIGLRANSPASGDAYYDMLMFNSIYGNGTHSKLFNNVREKLSLAYYAYSRLIRQKSVILVSTGIEFDKFDLTKKEIFHQLTEMQKGNITDFEMEAARNSIVNAYKSLSDNPVNLEDLYIGGIVAGADETLEEMIEKVNRVTKEGIIMAANKVAPDTIYFLKGAQA